MLAFVVVVVWKDFGLSHRGFGKLRIPNPGEAGGSTLSGTMIILPRKA
jgi:hypothetical protein